MSFNLELVIGFRHVCLGGGVVQIANLLWRVDHYIWQKLHAYLDSLLRVKIILKHHAPLFEASKRNLIRSKYFIFEINDNHCTSRNPQGGHLVHLKNVRHNIGRIKFFKHKNYKIIPNNEGSI